MIYFLVALAEALVQTMKIAWLQAVVCTNTSLAQAQQINEMCRESSPPIPFVLAQTRGVCAQVFCDFGAEFTIFDVDGVFPPRKKSCSL